MFATRMKIQNIRWFFSQNAKLYVAVIKIVKTTKSWKRMQIITQNLWIRWENRVLMPFFLSRAYSNMRSYTSRMAACFFMPDNAILSTLYCCYIDQIFVLEIYKYLKHKMKMRNPFDKKTLRDIQRARLPFIFFFRSWINWITVRCTE